MAPIGKYYLGATPEGPLSPNGGGGSANSNGMSAPSSNRNSVQQVAQHARQSSQQSPPIHIRDVNPIPAPVSNPSSPPLRSSSFFNQVPGQPQGETPLNRSSDAEAIARIEPLPASLPSDQEDEDGDEDEYDSPTTRARKTAERRKHTGTMRKDFKFPPPPSRDSGLPDIELPEEDQYDVPGTPVTPRTPKTAPPPPAPVPASAPPPPMIVVHAAKDSMNPTPPPKRVDLPEVVLPDPPTPNSDGEQTPPGGRVIRLGRRESEDDLGETVEVDLS